jgi:uncharacterized protein (DUF1330 family)
LRAIDFAGSVSFVGELELVRIVLEVEMVIHGNPTGMALVMDFDSADAITKLFQSDDYAALVPVRDRGFAEMNILVTQDT